MRFKIAVEFLVEVPSTGSSFQLGAGAGAGAGAVQRLLITFTTKGQELSTLERTLRDFFSEKLKQN